ncbi:hypothetical protein B0H13DRAFT_2360395 [Mycena leptocephala]|nr:hypothetical protein B0H13DRAFT_2360395 [Mycena leptocephala]
MQRSRPPSAFLLAPQARRQLTQTRVTEMPLPLLVLYIHRPPPPSPLTSTSSICRQQSEMSRPFSLLLHPPSSFLEQRQHELPRRDAAMRQRDDGMPMCREREKAGPRKNGLVSRAHRISTVTGTWSGVRRTFPHRQKVGEEDGWAGRLERKREGKVDADVMLTPSMCKRKRPASSLLPLALATRHWLASEEAGMLTRSPPVKWRPFISSPPSSFLAFATERGRWMYVLLGASASTLSICCQQAGRLPFLPPSSLLAHAAGSEAQKLGFTLARRQLGPAQASLRAGEEGLRPATICRNIESCGEGWRCTPHRPAASPTLRAGVRAGRWGDAVAGTGELCPTWGLRRERRSAHIQAGRKGSDEGEGTQTTGRPGRRFVGGERFRVGAARVCVHDGDERTIDGGAPNVLDAGARRGRIGVWRVSLRLVASSQPRPSRTRPPFLASFTSSASHLTFRPLSPSLGYTVLYLSHSLSHHLPSSILMPSSSLLFHAPCPILLPAADVIPCAFPVQYDIDFLHATTSRGHHVILPCAHSPSNILICM